MAQPLREIRLETSEPPHLLLISIPLSSFRGLVE
jgi:hypothetical protein